MPVTSTFSAQCCLCLRVGKCHYFRETISNLDRPSSGLFIWMSMASAFVEFCWYCAKEKISFKVLRCFFKSVVTRKLIIFFFWAFPFRQKAKQGGTLKRRGRDLGSVDQNIEKLIKCNLGVKLTDWLLLESLTAQVLPKCPLICVLPVGFEPTSHWLNGNHGQLDYPKCQSPRILLPNCLCELAAWAGSSKRFCR